MDAGREFIKGMVRGKLLSESVDVRYYIDIDIEDSFYVEYTYKQVT